ncbi:MAG: DUF4845 domain-containing protein, partial [Candidatus Thiodiazotropha sp. (ex Gloverina cf. vestifex)]|nr:DUF4845 domain-containing protein [Candidatus Thiodiazotropha sp. (ex Gloverina cf. vestifex)]
NALFFFAHGSFEASERKRSLTNDSFRASLDSQNKVTRMRSKQKQQGLTFISWLVVLIVVGFMVMVGLKITPVYLEHFTIRKSLESLKDEPLLSRKSVSEIRKILFRRLDMNSVYRLTKDEVSIKRSGGVTNITIKYEERRDVVGNLSMVMVFEDSIELISN